MSEQHNSKSAKAESQLTPEAVSRAYRLAEECLDALCEVCGSARAVEETYQQADETNRRLFGHLMDEAAEKARRWQMDVGVPKAVGVLAELESATTPQMEDAACRTVQGGVSYGLIGRRENSALVAVMNGIALIVKDQNAVGVIGWQCEGLLNNAKDLRVALNAERVRVAAISDTERTTPVANSVISLNDSPNATFNIGNLSATAAVRDLNQQEPRRRSGSGQVKEFCKKWAWLGAILAGIATVVGSVAAAIEILKWLQGR